MATADKLSYLNTTKGKIKDSINLTGANITNETTFRNYAVLLKDKLAEGIGDIETFKDTLITNFPKTTATGTNISITAYSTWLDLSLIGDTSQDGTPTPTTPSPVNVVSGLQEVDIVGKNLSNIDDIQIGKSWSNVNNNSRASIVWIPIKDHQSYTLVSSWTNSHITNIRLVFNKGASDTTSNLVPTSFPWSSGNYTYASIEILADTTFTSDMLEGVKIMLCEGSATINDYEPYKSQSYDINLGKNLLDYSLTSKYKNLSSVILSKIDNGIRATMTDSGTYRYGGYVFDIGTLKGETLTLSATITPSASNIGSMRVYGWTGGGINTQLTLNNGTFTIPSDFAYNQIAILLYGNTNGTANIGDYVDYTNIQLEKGNQATSYSEYFTPIELCKIGTYQDKIYKSNGKWYLHKEIGKRIFNGSENGWYTQTGTSGFYRYYASISDINVSSSLQSEIIVKSNNFRGITFLTRNTDTNETIYVPTNNGTQYILFFNTNVATTLANFKTWLSTHNTIVYYILANPTTTEIDNSELVSELNNIELIDGLNNISALGDLPTIMEVIGLEKE